MKRRWRFTLRFMTGIGSPWILAVAKYHEVDDQMRPIVWAALDFGDRAASLPSWSTGLFSEAAVSLLGSEM